MSDAEAAYSAGSMFGAGAGESSRGRVLDRADGRLDTTASALGIVIMAAVLHPAATELAQQELDRVVGRSRPPGFEDVQDLLYVEAFIKETYRWRPVSPAGFTHATTKAIAYKNYLIPRGTMIQGCHWAIGRDPLVFPDGDTFRPERWFVDENVKSGVLRTDLNHTQWGFGRRVCAGKVHSSSPLVFEVLTAVVERRATLRVHQHCSAALEFQVFVQEGGERDRHPDQLDGLHRLGQLAPYVLLPRRWMSAKPP